MNFVRYLSTFKTIYTQYGTIKIIIRKSKARRWKSQVRRRKSKVRRRKSKVRRRKSKVRRRESKVRRRKSKVRRQKSEVGAGKGYGAGSQRYGVAYIGLRRLTSAHIGVHRRPLLSHIKNNLHTIWTSSVNCPHSKQFTHNMDVVRYFSTFKSIYTQYGLRPLLVH